jgi:hypothetical protein
MLATLLHFMFFLCNPNQTAIITKIVIGLYSKDPLMSNFNKDNKDLVIPQVGHGMPKKRRIGHPTSVIW